MGKTELEQHIEEVQVGLAELGAMLKAIQAEIDRSKVGELREALREMKEELQALSNKWQNRLAGVCERIGKQSGN